MGATHFLVKTLPRVASEMALHVLAYNFTRVMNIMGIQPLLAAIGRSRQCVRPLPASLQALSRPCVLHSQDPLRTLGEVSALDLLAADPFQNFPDSFRARR